MSGSLAGKVAIVTGGSAGIGRAIAIALAAEDAAVVVNGRSDEKVAAVVREIADFGGTAIAVIGDVANASCATALIGAALDHFSALDIVVTSAGFLRDRMLVTMSEEDWNAVLEVHLTGTFLMARAAARHWRGKSKETGGPAGGRFVAMTSEAGYSGNVGQANYAAAKGGVNSLILTAAQELGRYGVTLHAIGPRGRTGMTEGLFDFEGDAGMRSAWDPANVAPLVLFLVSDAGAPYTGQLWISGGGEMSHVVPPQVDHRFHKGSNPMTLADAERFVREACGERAVGSPSTAAQSLGLIR